MPDGRSIDDFLLAEWKWPKGLREQVHLGRADGDFARARAKQGARHANHIADIEQVEQAIRLVAELILLEIQLDASALVGGGGEGRLPMRPPRDDAPSDANGVAFFLLPVGLRRDGIHRSMTAVEA